MMFWTISSAIAGIVAAGIISFKLIVWPDKFNWLERFGMGMIGAGMVLTIAPLFAYAQGHGAVATPFDDWGSAWLRIGCCLYFVGRMMRHRMANWAQRRMARRELRDRGL